MIEPARIVTSGKIKTDVNTVKQNINFWNNLHQLGLTGFREKTGAATWNATNCVIAIRELGTSMTEILLLVAQRQTNYRWFYGFQPDAAAHEGWNRFFQLMPREMLDTTYHQIPPPLPQISLDIAALAAQQEMSEFARLVRISEMAEARIGKDAYRRDPSTAVREIENQIAQAQEFKRKQDALSDLTPEHLAEVFLALVPHPDQSPIPSTPMPALDQPTAEQTRDSFQEQQPVPLRRGGPLPASDDEKEKMINEWKSAQGKETQEDFCNRKGIGTSTLRAWIRDLRARNKLSPQ